MFPKISPKLKQMTTRNLPYLSGQQFHTLCQKIRSQVIIGQRHFLTLDGPQRIVTLVEPMVECLVHCTYQGVAGFTLVMCDTSLKLAIPGTFFISVYTRVSNVSAMLHTMVYRRNIFNFYLHSLYEIIGPWHVLSQKMSSKKI